MTVIECENENCKFNKDGFCNEDRISVEVYGEDSICTTEETQYKVEA